MSDWLLRDSVPDRYAVVRMFDGLIVETFTNEVAAEQAAIVEPVGWFVVLDLYEPPTGPRRG